eukprot:TRINITY_DN68345_c0_g1_i1.p1 TRINITY_DN68345_c0_g1~~TRINITY_DN68345_c0_g1_i1.p1  ORF type:complete len:120 (+),score=24.48 TRINITY_DN68345_c0_g1_i1:117-476(+)
MHQATAASLQDLGHHCCTALPKWVVAQAKLREVGRDILSSLLCRLKQCLCNTFETFVADSIVAKADRLQNAVPLENGGDVARTCIANAATGQIELSQAAMSKKNSGKPMCALLPKLFTI